MKEISHETSGGIGEHLACSFVTCGLGALLPVEPKHEVVVEHDDKIGVGHGSTHAEARDNAIRDLNDDKSDDDDD